LGRCAGLADHHAEGAEHERMKDVEELAHSRVHHRIVCKGPVCHNAVGEPGFVAHGARNVLAGNENHAVEMASQGREFRVYKNLFRVKVARIFVGAIYETSFVFFHLGGNDTALEETLQGVVLWSEVIFV
jgi:hypothetical protein